MSKYILKEKLNLLLQIIATILFSTSLAAAIFFTKKLFETENKIPMVLLIGLFLVLVTAFNYVKDRIIYNMGVIFVEDLKKDLFHNVISQNFSEIEEKEKVFSNDITSTSIYLKEYYVIPTLESVSHIIALISVILAVGFTVDFICVSVLAVGVLIFSLINEKLDKSIMDKKVNTSNLRKRYVYFLEDMLSSKKVINSKANRALEVVHSKLIEDISEKVVELDKEELIKYNLNLFFMSVYFICSLIFIVEEKTSNTGEVIILLSSIILLYHLIKKLVKERSMIVQADTKIFEMEEVLGKQEKSNKAIENLKDIEFQDVKLYSSNIKLKVNYTFYTDKKYLIICDNDEVINLLAKAFNQSLTPQSGEMLVNGKPIGGYDLTQNLLVTYDESYIFDTTFKNNVTLFNSFADEKVSVLSHIFDEELESKQRYSDYQERDKNLIRYKRIINQNSDFNMVFNLFDNLDESTGNILLEDFLTRFKGCIYCAKEVDNSLKGKFDKVMHLDSIDNDYLLVQE